VWTASCSVVIPLTGKTSGTHSWSPGVKLPGVFEQCSLRALLFGLSQMTDHGMLCRFAMVSAVSPAAMV
jgi:hypothetical protein